MFKRIKLSEINIIELFSIFTVLFIILSIIFSSIYSNEIEKNSDNLSVLIKKTVSQDEVNLKNYTSLAINISENPDILFFLQGNSTENETIYKIGDQLNKYKSMLSGINDILIYDDKKKNLYSSYSISTALTDYIDTTLTDQLKKAPLERKQLIITPADNRIKQDTGSASYIFSRIKNVNDAVIINITEKNMYNSYSALSSEITQPVIVTDGEGNIIYGNDTYNFGKNVKDEKFYINRNHNKNSVSGIFENETVFFDYVYSEYCDRWYITATPKKTILLRSIADNNFIALCIIFFIAAFLIYSLLKYIFSLQKKVLTHIESIQTDWNNNPQYDFNNKNKLYEYISNPQQYNSDEFIRLLPPGISYEEIGVVCVHIPKNTLLIDSDLSIYRYGINNICSEIFNKYSYCCNIFENEKENKLIYIIGNISKTHYEESVIQAAKICKEKVFDYAEINISVYISSLYPFEDLPLAFFETREISEYKFLYSDDILSASVIKPKSTRHAEDCLKLCEQISQSILLNKEDEYELFSEVEKLFLEMNISNIRNVIQHFMVYLHTVINNLKKRNEINIYLDAEIMLSKLKNSYSFEEFSEEFSKFCDLIKAERNQIDNNKHSVIIAKVQNIISEEYKNELLNVEYIAEKLGFSANYLRKVFKQSEGIGIADKIIDIRLEEAEKLLLQTNKPVKEIMDSLGFTNNSYFAVLFKKKYGVTPSVYRRSSKL